MKISELPLTTSVTGSEILPIVQSGTTKKVSISDALAGAGGVNPNNTYFPYNNNGTFADSPMQYEPLNDTIRTLGGTKGFSLDFINMQFEFGTTNVYGGNRLIIEDNASKIYTLLYTSQGLGISLDAGNGLYNFGAYNPVSGNPTYFQIDTTAQIIKTISNGNTLGFYFDSQNKQMGLSSSNVTQEGFWFGNYDNTNRFCSVGFADSGYSYLIINENDIRTYSNYLNYGLELKLSSFEFYFGGTSGNGAATFYVNNNINICQMGDVAGNNTSAAFGIDVNNETMLATTNLLTPNSGSSSGQHLKINVGGTDYVIELKNP